MPPRRGSHYTAAAGKFVVREDVQSGFARRGWKCSRRYYRTARASRARRSVVLAGVVPVARTPSWESASSGGAARFIRRPRPDGGLRRESRRVAMTRRVVVRRCWRRAATAAGTRREPQASCLACGRAPRCSSRRLSCWVIRVATGRSGPRLRARDGRARVSNRSPTLSNGSVAGAAVELSERRAWALGGRGAGQRGSGCLGFGMRVVGQLRRSSRGHPSPRRRHEGILSPGGPGAGRRRGD